MKFEEFYKELTGINASIISREKYANLVLNNKILIPRLIETLFMTNDQTSSRAAWVLEFACKKDLSIILPFLDEFTNNIKTVHLDSSVRPVSKIVNLIAQAYSTKKTNAFETALTRLHREQIIEACFDWLIQDKKVAAKVYAMETLYLLGQDEAWIYRELRLIIEQNFSKQSAAFKSKAKHILNKLKKAQNQSKN
ncbi:hypothetical protein [Gaetbulibacter saemankumensis]|uniref:hypothetical protein n=1 Tax=Gaetbulibacter saemankumensis TaxID=311208 RepID=UPI00042A8E13|nr:hypothetical protein [Gaetbulibacter saemankumensis]